jgi:pimeloyl-ACP methyl ester carboxylesterase
MEVRSNGCSFRCSLEGRAGAPLITLSHGLATDMTMWDDLVPLLTPRYRVLRHDSRGHGSSAATGGDYSLAMLEDDVIGILDALDLAKTHFVGLSMGGMVGLGLALARPKRMASVAVCDARGSAPAEYRARLDRPQPEGPGRRHRGHGRAECHAVVHAGLPADQSAGHRTDAQHGPPHFGGRLLRLRGRFA